MGAMIERCLQQLKHQNLRTMPWAVTLTIGVALGFLFARVEEYARACPPPDADGVVYCDEWIIALFDLIRLLPVI